MIKAASGMTTNCANIPIITGIGFVTISLKSAPFNVSPMPNITIPNKSVIYSLKMRNGLGKKKAIQAKKSTHKAKNFPATTLIFSKNFIVLFLFEKHLLIYLYSEYFLDQVPV